MPLSALALILLAAVLHAGWNLAVKSAGESGAAFIWAAAFASTILWGPLALGLHGAEVASLGLAAWLCVAASALIHVFYFLLLLHAYRVADLSVVYPVARGSGPLLASLLAIAWLGEALGPWAAAGLGMIVAGTITIAGGPALAFGVRTPKVLAGIGWGALTGLTVAAYTLNDGYAVRYLGVSPLLFDWLGIAGRALLLGPFVLLARGELVQTVQRSWRVIAIVALLSPAAYILALQAMTFAPVSRVAPARELSMLVATLFGARLLGEPDMWRRLAGAALIATGVAALSLSD
jgi:drug/metabolite transporter (DMT)-like permease